MKFLAQKKKNGVSLKERRGLGRRDGGYTLLELAVTLFIILTITAISRFGKTQFERSLVLTNLAYDIALTIRQAQTYGVNSRQADATATASFDVGYGIRFAQNATSFSIFTDADKNRFLGGDTIIRNGTYNIRNKNKISTVCLVPVSNPNTCTSFSSVDITFRRPDPDACFNPNGAGVSNASTASLCQATLPYSEARITIQAQGGNTKLIKVYSTGQVVVQ